MFAIKSTALKKKNKNRKVGIMQEFQTLVYLLSLLLGIVAFIYMGLLGMWFLGAFPFHTPTRDATAIPVRRTDVPIAVCPNCGFRHPALMMLAVKLQDQEQMGENQ
jgi:hypothetical protein